MDKNMCCKSFLNRACLGALLGLLSSAANALLFTGSPGNWIGSVDLPTSGNTLVVLVNTSSADGLLPSDVLTAVFIDISGSLTLSSVNAALTSGTSVSGGQAASDDAGGEHGYASGLDLIKSFSARSQAKISSDLSNVLNFPALPGADSAEPSNAGLGGLQNHARRAQAYRTLFRASNGAHDGLQYGLLLAGANHTTGSFGEIVKPRGLIKNSVTYTLTGISANDVLSNVYYQSGVALSESGYVGNCVSGYCRPLAITDPADSEPDSLWLFDWLRHVYWVVVRWIFAVFHINQP
ncbi:MAG: hypothetical protein CTY34_09110 [Methylobacter sp.]|nr:MAG: hypothetical protein CTY34_09110 [Methylobacter sp.]PPD33918.1 MAG: hypothetical protein CTY18_09195 [Methylomonas sp.]